MNILFWVALIFLLFSIPPLLFITAFYLLSKKFKLSYKIVGYLKFRDIFFFYENKYFHVNAKLDQFQIYLIWFRCRISFQNLEVNIVINNKSLSFIKSRPVNKADFVDTFVLKRQVSSQSENEYQSEFLIEVKNRFFELINQKYLKKHKLKNKENCLEEEVIDNILKKSEISKKDNFIRNLITFFDFMFERVEINFKLSEMDTYHNVHIRKLIVGGVKGINKHKEIHFICIAYDIKIKEYLKTKLPNNNEEYSEYNEFILFSNQKMFLNFKLEYGLFPKNFQSLLNTITLKFEISKTKVELSIRAIKAVFKIISQLIKLSKLKDKEIHEQRTSSIMNNINMNNESGLHSTEISPFLPDPKHVKKISFEIPLNAEAFVECIEEVILMKIESQMKKMKIKLIDMEIKIVSDNHQFIYTNLNFSHLTYHSKNDLNYYYDSNKVKLLKSWAEIKIQDLVLSSYKKEKVILDLQNYTLNLTEDIVYYHQTKEASIRSTLNSETPNVDIVMSVKELDKIIELIICIVVGFEKLEAHSERNFFINRQIEKYNQHSLLNFNFEKVNMTVFNDIVQTEVNNVALNVRVEEEKFVGSKVDILFNPFSVCVFTKASTKYSSNVLIKGFKLNIKDDLKSSKVDIMFEETKVICYDNHLIDVLKFVADFLTNCLKRGVKKTHNSKTKFTGGYKIKYSNIMPNDAPTTKKEFCTLLFKKVIVYNYVDFDDIMTIKIEDLDFRINEWMLVPKIRIYHQSTTNQFLKKKTKFINLERFFIKFSPETNEIFIDFGHIVLNAYCFEILFVISKLSIYHSFLPFWIVYHMAYKHNIDDDYKKIYVADFAKKDRCYIKFGTVIVKVNQNEISSCAILQTNPFAMKVELEKSDKKEVSYLKNLKCDQITIKVTNFSINTWGYKEKETSNGNFVNDKENEKEYVSSGYRTISYYKKIIKKGGVDLNFETIDIYQENSKLIELKNFHIITNDEFVYDNFDLNTLNSIACSYKMHNVFYKELNSRKTKTSMVEIFVENLKVNLEDVKIIDKITLFYYQAVKTFLSFPFKEYALTEIMDNQKSEISGSLNLYLKNFQAVVNSIDPITNLIYNRLYLKIDLLSLSKEETPKLDKMELSVFYLTFGFEFSQNFDYPLIIIPVSELNIDNKNNIIRLNVPNKKIKKIKRVKNCDNPLVPNDNLYVTELDRFIMETKSFTLFFNFNYLNTFYKIFENFWRRSEYVKKYFFDKSGSETGKNQSVNVNRTVNQLVTRENMANSVNLSKISVVNDYSTCLNHDNKDDIHIPNEIYSDVSTEMRNKDDQKPFKLILTVFDFKIIYLVLYKNEYNSIFKFHTEVKEKGYFGYIIRFYSTSLKYLKDTKNVKRDELKLNTNLLTVSFLHEENFDDDKFFTYDKEIKFSRFHNLKLQKNFNELMELPTNNKYKIVNKNFFKFFYYEDNVNTNTNMKTATNIYSNNISSKYNSTNNVSGLRKNSHLSSPVKKRGAEENEPEYFDTIFDYKHTLIKVFDISFKRDTMSVRKIEEIYIVVNDIKLTWNKFNMDVVSILVFHDVLLIVDKIILKIDDGNEKDKKAEELPFVSVLDLGRFNFVFELNEPQICIQNEIKDSKVLLTTKSKCTAKISKICVNENQKDFKLEIQLNDMLFYIAPNYMEDSYIYWIGESDENNYYLDETLFNKMLESPKIQFLIFENIRNNPTTLTADLYTNNSILVEKIAGDFSSAYFNHFLNVIEVFIFDRGYSYAEQKDNIDSRAKDLELFRYDEIKNRIKMNTSSFISYKKSKQKEITFVLKDVVLTLLKENKEIIKLMMRNFEGEHIIYTDKASETSINVKNLKILDLFKNKNETILTPNFEIQNIGEFENRIDLVTFRKKDSYVSIGTETKWYVLDYYEFNILPLLINTSKYHCDFIIEFFFDNPNTVDKTEDEYKSLLIGGSSTNLVSKGRKNTNEMMTTQPQPQMKAKNKDKPAEPSYPIYFKHFRINETQLFISFFLADNSPFNLQNAKLKFSAFEKKEKFYTYGVLLNRLIGHLKFISFTNASNILASLFNWSGAGGGNTNIKKKKRDDEEAHRRMLLGKQSNK